MSNTPITKIVAREYAKQHKISRMSPTRKQAAKAASKEYKRTVRNVNEQRSWLRALNFKRQEV